MTNFVTVDSIDEASRKLSGVVKTTPLQYCQRLSEKYNSKIYFKREDLQKVRSYKIRGAYNLMSSLVNGEMKNGVVCASAGNHAQGVALSSAKLKIKAVIFMPNVTQLQKINKVKSFGKEYVEIKLIGGTFDESNTAAKKFALENDKMFIPPFDDYQVISGQGTVGKEIYEQLGGENLGYFFCPIGGGGLVSGAGTYLKTKLPHMKLIGVEPEGAAGMYYSVCKGKVTSLPILDTFVDGAAVKTVGEKTFNIAKNLIDKFALIANGAVCTTMIELYQNEGIITEPAGILSIAALDEFAKEIKGKTIVCVISGGNNDILRYPEIMEKSLVYQGLKHYFLVQFTQKPGALKQFVSSALNPTDDIVRFEYIKKTSREMGPALVGVELVKKEDYPKLLDKMNKLGISYTIINDSDVLFHYLV